MANNTNRTLSYAEEAAENNSIYSAWTRTWGIHIRPWYEKDKLKFSFVEVGKSGKGASFDIFMDTIKYGAPCFMKWANDILSPTRRFESIMAQEAKDGEQYPKHYKYVTGNNGNKSIGICNSKKGGYCINASVRNGDKNSFCNIPVEYDDLLLIAQEFMATYEPRQKQLREMRIEAEERLSKHYEDKDGSYTPPAQEEDFEQSKPISTPEVVNMHVCVTKFVVAKDGVTFTGTDDNNAAVELFVTNDTLKGDQKATWNKFSLALQENPSLSVNFKVVPGDRIEIKGFA